MKVPLSWLKEYLPIQLTAKEIAETLTLIGLEVEKYEDEILEIALTPNLSHCASIRGVARELAAITATSLTAPAYKKLTENKELTTSSATQVAINNSKLAPRYACRLLQKVKVGPSPTWLKKRLEEAGLRSINNVVDVTNYVLLEWGQPLHAFDFERLDEGRIVVRNAHGDETITTLDGKTHYLTEETLVICDAHKPVAIAGIMGSLESQVTENTQTVLLESAYFDSLSIRRTSKRLGIQSDASYRFERGTDPNDVVLALDRAAALLCEITQGEALKGVIDTMAHPFLEKRVTCRLERVNQLLGTRLAMSEIETLFTRLGLKHAKVVDDQITLHIPTYRHDIHHEIDLIEEIARLYGYNNLSKQEKPRFRTGTLAHSQEYLFGRRIREALIAEGLQEFLTCDLISPQQSGLIASDIFAKRNLIKLLNPYSTEQSIMRPSLLPGLLSVVKSNANHSIDSIAGFEVGRVHFTSKERYFEPPVVALVLAGQKAPPFWDQQENAVDFFDLKGILENLFKRFKIPTPELIASHYSNFHPHRQATIFIGNVEVGMIGQVHPHTLRQVDLENPVFFAELNLEDLQYHAKNQTHMEPLPQYPASSRDWTLTLDANFPVDKILAQLTSQGSKLLESASIIAIYSGDKVAANLKNVTFRLVYRDLQKTISFAEVQSEHEQLIKKIENFLNI